MTDAPQQPAASTRLDSTRQMPKAGERWRLTEDTRTLPLNNGEPSIPAGTIVTVVYPDMDYLDWFVTGVDVDGRDSPGRGRTWLRWHLPGAERVDGP